MTESWFLRAAQYLNAEFSLGLQILPEIKMSKRPSKNQLAVTVWYEEHTPSVIVNQLAIEQDPVTLLSILLHELIHCVLPHWEGHGKKFSQKARAAGLTGRMTATYPGAVLEEKLKIIIQKLQKPRLGTTMTTNHYMKTWPV